MEVNALVLAGCINFAAAILHIAIILGGASWYRYFGAGEDMATLAELGSVKPAMITSFIAAVLIVWGLIAWSGAGLVVKLPFLKWLLAGITAVYIVRAIAGLILPFASKHPKIKENSLTFWLTSSFLCLFIALVHLQGLMVSWDYL